MAWEMSMRDIGRNLGGGSGLASNQEIVAMPLIGHFYKPVI
jgi:hypothetical protein